MSAQRTVTGVHHFATCQALVVHTYTSRLCHFLVMVPGIVYSALLLLIDKAWFLVQRSLVFITQVLLKQICRFTRLSLIATVVRLRPHCCSRNECKLISGSPAGRLFVPDTFQYVVSCDLLLLLLSRPGRHGNGPHTCGICHLQRHHSLCDYH